MTHLESFIFQNAYSYEAYRQLIDQRFSDHKTTGIDHSESMLNYTSLNIARMNRLDKKNRLTEETKSFLKSIQRPLTWLVLTEGWCGDAAQIVPVLHYMAKENEQITLKFVLRDENLPLMDAFLTDGGRSIPKVIILDTESLEIFADWGPRPTVPQELVLEGKKKAQLIEDESHQQEIKEETSKQLHLWYAKNKTIAIQNEFLAVLSKI